MLLPFPAVDGRNGDLLDGPIIKATHIDAETFRMRARHVEGFDPADGAEKMFRGLCIELIGRQEFRAGEELEPGGWDREV